MASELGPLLEVISAVERVLQQCKDSEQGLRQDPQQPARPPLTASAARKLNGRLRDACSRSAAVARALDMTPGDRGPKGELVNPQTATLQTLLEALQIEVRLAHYPVPFRMMQEVLREALEAILYTDRKMHLTHVKNFVKERAGIELDKYMIRTLATTMPDVQVTAIDAKAAVFELSLKEEPSVVKRYVCRRYAMDVLGNLMLQNQSWSGRFGVSELATHLLQDYPELQRKFLHGHVDDLILNMLRPPKPALGFIILPGNGEVLQLVTTQTKHKGKKVVVRFEESDDKTKYDKQRHDVLLNPHAYVRDENLPQTVIDVMAKSSLVRECKNEERFPEMCLDILLNQLQQESERLCKLQMVCAAFGDQYEYIGSIADVLRAKLENQSQARVVQDNIFEVVHVRHKAFLRLRLDGLRALLQEKGPINIGALRAQYLQKFGHQYANRELPAYMSNLLEEGTMRKLANKVPGLVLDNRDMLKLRKDPLFRQPSCLET